MIDIPHAYKILYILYCHAKLLDTFLVLEPGILIFSTREPKMFLILTNAVSKPTKTKMLINRTLLCLITLKKLC